MTEIKITDIIEKLNNFHKNLAKSTLEQEEYQPLSKELIEIKQIMTTTKLGEYLYLAMGTCNGHKVVMGVGYTPEYAKKKALQFQDALGHPKLMYVDDISVIRAGDKVKESTIKLNEIK